MTENREEQLRIQALGAALSRRDWHATEMTYNAIRDEFDRRPVSPSTASSDAAAVEGRVAKIMQLVRSRLEFYERNKSDLTPEGHHGSLVLTNLERDMQALLARTPTPSDAMTDERGPLAWTISPKTEAAIKEIDGNLRSARLRASDLVAGAATPTPTQDYDAERNRIARIICPDGLGSGDPMETAYWKDALSYADLILATRPSPAAVDAWQDIAQEARFLLDRLEELDDANDAEYIREFEGHVRPPMSRLRRLLPRHDCEESQS
jgi:hypothetical protein